MNKVIHYPKAFLAMYIGKWLRSLWGHIKK